MSNGPNITQTAAEVSTATASGIRTSQAILEATAAAASNVRATFAALDISSSSDTSALLTFSAMEASVSGVFPARMTQAALTVSSSGAFRTRGTQLCAEISVTRGGAARVSGPVRFFSTGILYVVNGGSKIELALLQNVTARFKTEAKRLYDSLTSSALPVDVGFTDGEAALQAEMASLSPDGVTQLLGGNLTGVTAYQILSLARGLAKRPFQAILMEQDTLGRQHQWTFSRVFCPSLTLPVTATDFLKPQFTMNALPDSNGIVATVALVE
jgi:hypothetical protein